jgi:hypothetical protein
MAIQNNLEAPITATSAADALKQYEEAKKAKKANGEKPKAAKPPVPAKQKAPAKKAAKNHGDKKRSKKAKVASKAKKAAKKAPRIFKAEVTGTTLKSRMVRISTELADFLTGEASRSDITVTEASRILVEGLLK